MGRRSISDLQEYGEYPRGLLIKKTMRSSPLGSLPYTPDISELPGEYKKPKSHDEE